MNGLDYDLKSSMNHRRTY